MSSGALFINYPPQPHPDPQALRRLRRQWLAALLLGGASLAVGYQLLIRTLGPGSAYTTSFYWLLLAAAVLAVELVVVWKNLDSNRSPNRPQLLPTLGYGTALTLLCGLLIALLAGFIAAGRPQIGWLAWTPAILYTAARIIDFFDGFVARISNHETELGAILDIEFDGLGILIAIILGIQYGTLPLWYLPLGLARQLFIGGIWLRKRRNLPVHDLPSSENRRIIAGFQTGFITVVLWPIWEPPVMRLCALVLALPLAASFLRDWLVVSDALDPESAFYRTMRHTVKSLMEGWLPLLGRMSGLFLTAWIVARQWPAFVAWQSYLASAGFTSTQDAIYALLALTLFSLPFFTLGIVGRLAAFPILAIALCDISSVGIRWTDNAWLLIAALLVAHFSSGRAALWQPEEYHLHRRLGGDDQIAQ